jgi:hypothetical protein
VLARIGIGRSYRWPVRSAKLDEYGFESAPLKTYGLLGEKASEAGRGRIPNRKLTLSL